jgi:methionyl-tRNA synthetase
MAAQLNAPRLTFQAMETAKLPLLDRSRPVGEAVPIIGRMEEVVVAKLVQAQVEPTQPSARALKSAEEKPPPAEIEYADFERVVLKVGKVLGAEAVPKQAKLLKLTVEVGEAAPRTIVSGIAEAYTPEALIGRHVVVVMNLKPRLFKQAGLESRGMLLTAGAGGKDLVLLDPGNQPPGAEVK